MSKQKLSNWKDIFSAESQEAFWEIIHDSKAQSVRLVFVPDEDYNKKTMVDIKLNYGQFEDLCRLINRISKP